MLSLLMSEVDRPEAFKQNAQKLDLQALADAFEAKGEHEQARQLREQAEKQQQVRKSTLGNLEEQTPQEESRQSVPEVKQPGQKQRKAERLDVEALADALEQQGKQKDAKYFHELAQKHMSQRQSKPPETR